MSYVLQRSDDGQNGWATIASPTVNVIAYSNTGLTADTSYYYRVVARNNSGDSTASAVVSGHTLLPAVTDLTATGVSTTQVDLEWDDSSGESGYRIERSLNGTTWTLIASPAADETNVFEHRPGCRHNVLLPHPRGERGRVIAHPPNGRRR
jgi:titin